MRIFFIISVFSFYFGGLVTDDFVYAEKLFKEEKYDVNNDSEIDSWVFKYNDGRMRIELDNNLDGKVDSYGYYDKYQNPTKGEADVNFDGQIDKFEVYEEGILKEVQIDINGDKKIDYILYFKDDSTLLSTYYDLNNNENFDVIRIFKQNHLGESVFNFAEVDSDGDGKMDKKYLNDQELHDWLKKNYASFVESLEIYEYKREHLPSLEIKR